MDKQVVKENRSRIVVNLMGVFAKWLPLGDAEEARYREELGERMD